MRVLAWLIACTALIIASGTAVSGHEVSYTNVMSSTRNFGGLDEKSLTSRLDNIMDGASFMELALQDVRLKLMDRNQGLWGLGAIMDGVSPTCMQHLNMTLRSLFSRQPWAMQSK